VLCATRRLVVSPPQVGETRREVSGSDGLPGAERLRGQEHARKPATRSRRLRWCAERPRVIWRKLDCLKPNLQEMQPSHPPERRLKPAPCSAMAMKQAGATFGAWSDAQRGY
jgi:hypothetical protein